MASYLLFRVYFLLPHEKNIIIIQKNKKKKLEEKKYYHLQQICKDIPLPATQTEMMQYSSSC